MKKFEFSLSHMRDYKERLLDEEKGALELVKAQMKGTTIVELRKYSAQLDNVRLQQEERKKALAKAEQRVEKQMKVVIAANQEVSKLDKLQERQYEEYRHQVTKAEEDRIDEFVAQTLCRVAV